MEIVGQPDLGQDRRYQAAGNADDAHRQAGPRGRRPPAGTGRGSRDPQTGKRTSGHRIPPFRGARRRRRATRRPVCNLPSVSSVRGQFRALPVAGRRCPEADARWWPTRCRWSRTGSVRPRPAAASVGLRPPGPIGSGRPPTRAGFVPPHARPGTPILSGCGESTARQPIHDNPSHALPVRDMCRPRRQEMRCALWALASGAQQRSDSGRCLSPLRSGPARRSWSWDPAARTTYGGLLRRACHCERTGVCQVKWDTSVQFI